MNIKASFGRMRFFAAITVASCLCCNAEVSPSGMTKSGYLDLMEAAVKAYTDDRINSYYEESNRDGVQEHGFPRLAVNLAVLVANGRIQERRELVRKMMDVCCRDAKKGKMPPKSGGNEFAVKELVLAVAELEKHKIFPKGTTDGWRESLKEIVAQNCYTLGMCEPDYLKAQNWVIFGCASEQTRLCYEMGGDPKFVEKYVADQIRWFDSNGMYRDPNQPMAYDYVPRILFAEILANGYDGPSRAQLEYNMDIAAVPTLKVLSACGEFPYGGRSNQFLHNNTLYAALSEWYAARFARRGDMKRAMEFRRAAAESVNALKRWLAETPVSHVKNRYPRETGKGIYSEKADIGCERYAYFDKYMISMGSWALLGWYFADETIPAAEFSPAKPDVFVTSPAFHLAFMQAGEYSAQFDYWADTHYDCSGLGRFQRRGAPAELCMSTPCAKEPDFRLPKPNCSSLAIRPVVPEDAQWRLIHDAKTVKFALTRWRVGACEWECRLSSEGMEMELSGEGEVAMDIPAFDFDGKESTRIAYDGNSLSVSHRGWVCRYRTDGCISPTGVVVHNRNGRYRAFRAIGSKKLKVSISIDRCTGGGLQLIESGRSDNGRAKAALIAKKAVKLPVYPFSDPDPVPPVAEKCYPYFRFDGSSATNVARVFNTINMENGRISLDVLPEIGGKVWGATDLKTGFDFIYRNHVAKFRNVAMRGPWHSGGIEYNFGIIGHGPYTSTPVDCLARTNADGSVSCFISMTEFICRTVYQVEVRLAPGDDHFTMHTLWYNASALPVPYYHWMNCASPVEMDMVLKFDGRHQIGHEGDAHPWPVDEGMRNLSIYAENAFGHNKSYHVINGNNGIFGVWYPARKLGFVHENEYCDKYGRKAWIWALSREGAIWEDLLTDSDGQYVELQSGRAFNQPRFATVKTPFKHPSFSPGRTDRFAESWGVVRDESGYQPKGANPPSAAMPRPVESPKDFDWNGVYGHYLRGQQAIREREDARGEKELNAALAIDRNFVPALDELAFLMIRRGKYGDASELAQRALSIDTYDCAANYAAGFAAFAAHDNATAKERLGLAAYSGEYRNSAYALLSRISLRERDWGGAGAMAERVLSADGANRDALLAKIVALRFAGKTAAAREAVSAALGIWPLFHAAKYEASRIGAGDDWTQAVRNEFPEETLLEIASWYMESGLEDDAKRIERAAGACPMAMIRLGDFASAAKLSMPRLFPFRREDIPALDKAVSTHPSWKFKYYRATLAAYFQDDALADRLLDACGSEPDDFAFYLFRASRKSAGKRLDDLNRAAELSGNWRIGRELAAFHAGNGEWEKSLDAAGRFLKRNPKSNPLQIAYARALNGCRRWRETVEFLKGIQILPSEFGDNAWDIWHEAWKNLGDDKMADTYPENLGKGAPYK